MQIFQKAEYDRMVKEAETELVSTRKMLNLCKLLEAGCEKTPDASDIN